jgi:hypothetical protein
MLCGRGNRIPEAVYDLSRYEQAVPSTSQHTISRTPDRHDSVWFRVSLFTVF